MSATYGTYDGWKLATPERDPFTGCPLHSDGRHHARHIIGASDAGLLVRCKCGWAGTVELETALDCLAGSVEWEEANGGN